MKIALISMRPKIADKKANLQTMKEHISKTNADMYIFGEISLTGYRCKDELRNLVEAIDGSSVEYMKKRATQKGFTFPYLVDIGQEIFPLYGATKTPHVYLLEKNKLGNVVRYIGAIDDNYSNASAVKTKYVENAVDAMLKGEEISITTTRAIGCSIKSR